MEDKSGKVAIILEQLFFLRPLFVFFWGSAPGVHERMGFVASLWLQEASSTTTSVDDAPASVPGVRGSSYRVASLWLLVR